MLLVINLDLENQAFADDGCDEIARILSGVADRMPLNLDEPRRISLHDANGNWAGEAELTSRTNAALIAAAPDLLRHCQTMLSWWEKNPDVLKRFPTLAIDEIRAAIRKAEGGAE